MLQLKYYKGEERGITTSKGRCDLIRNVKEGFSWDLMLSESERRKVNHRQGGHFWQREHVPSMFKGLREEETACTGS